MGLSRPTPCRMPRDDVADVACVLIFPLRVQELSTKERITKHHTGCQEDGMILVLFWEFASGFVTAGRAC